MQLLLFNFPNEYKYGFIQSVQASVTFVPFDTDKGENMGEGRVTGPSEVVYEDNMSQLLDEGYLIRVEFCAGGRVRKL